MTDSVQPFDAIAFLGSLSPERRKAIAEAVSRTAPTLRPNDSADPWPPPDSAPDAPLPPAAQSVEQFVSGHGLAGLVDTARQIVERQFVLAPPVQAELVEDAEAGEEWVALSVHAKGEIPEVREAHRRFTREWLGAAPAGAATKVRLSISLA